MFVVYVVKIDGREAEQPDANGALVASAGHTIRHEHGERPDAGEGGHRDSPHVPALHRAREQAEVEPDRHRHRDDAPCCEREARSRTV